MVLEPRLTEEESSKPHAENRRKRNINEMSDRVYTRRMDGRNTGTVTQGSGCSKHWALWGVTLGSQLGKIFCQILKTRLEKVAEKNGILGKAPGGFRERKQMVQSLFVLNFVLQLQPSGRKRRWLAFLDLRKAFPSVRHKGCEEK